MMNLMAEDKDDRHRVKQWFMEKWVDVGKNAYHSKDRDREESDRRRAQEDDVGPVPKRQRGLSSPSSGGGIVRDREDSRTDDEDHAKRASINEEGDKRREGEPHPDDTKNQRLYCMNLARVPSRHG